MNRNDAYQLYGSASSTHQSLKQSFDGFAQECDKVFSSDQSPFFGAITDLELDQQRFKVSFWGRTMLVRWFMRRAESGGFVGRIKCTCTSQSLPAKDVEVYEIDFKRSGHAEIKIGEDVVKDDIAYGEVSVHLLLLMIDAAMQHDA